jgi:hypothetical protein
MSRNGQQVHISGGSGSQPSALAKKAAVSATMWLWLNIIICVVIFLAFVGVPLWLVNRRPDTGQETADVAALVGAKPIHEVSREEASQSRQLA